MPSIHQIAYGDIERIGDVKEAFIENASSAKLNVDEDVTGHAGG